jgi:two-component system sensor kinase FixL
VHPTFLAEELMTRIAVVDDDTVFLDMMAAVLEEGGWDTEVYRESDTAFSALKRTHPDLIILDIRMATPETGWAILDLLRLDPATVTIPVIVCSAAILDLRSHQTWLQEHGIAILPKPFDLTELFALVETALGERHRQPWWRRLPLRWMPARLRRLR